MATTLTALPSAIVAGDSLLFVLSLADYPADQSWVVTYTFRKKLGSDVTFASTPSGSSHLFDIDSGTTSGWTPGSYKGFARAVGTTATETFWEGWLTILPDLTQQSDNYDTRSHAQKCLDAINSVLEGKASRDVLASTIAGQSISRMSFDELLRAKSYYESVVAQEMAQIDADNGKATGKNILIRFGAA